MTHTEEGVKMVENETNSMASDRLHLVLGHPEGSTCPSELTEKC